MGSHLAHEWGTRRPPDWGALGAACLDDAIMDLFHASEADSNATKLKHEKAKEICETECPSSCFWACREYSLSMKETQMLGVMGGLTPKERRATMRAQNAKASEQSCELAVE